MLPFLAQVQVLNVANAVAGTVITPTPPDTPGSGEAALAELRATIAAVGAQAKAIAGTAKVKKTDLAEAGVSTEKTGAEDNPNHDKDGDDSGDTTVRSGNSSVVIHHKKSSDETGFVVPCMAIFFVFTWLIVKAVMAPFNQRAAARRAGVAPSPTGQGLTEAEQAILLKLQRTLAQMESRVESLETILIDETRTKEKYGTKH